MAFGLANAFSNLNYKWIISFILGLLFLILLDIFNLKFLRQAIDHEFFANISNYSYYYHHYK